MIGSRFTPWPQRHQAPPITNLLRKIKEKEYSTNIVHIIAYSIIGTSIYTHTGRSSILVVLVEVVRPIQKNNH